MEHGSKISRKKKFLLPFVSSRATNGNQKLFLTIFDLRSSIVLFSIAAFQLPPIPGRVAQSVTCLATDACLTADPGVASSIPARYHTFVEIDHEIISTVILLPSADLFKKGCCQLQAKVCAQITG